MSYLLEKAPSTKCALDASKAEVFTQRRFADLINECHSNSRDYIIARVNCKEKDPRTGQNIYYCYDSKSLCEYIFEMVVNEEGTKFKVKNFKDPINHKDIGDINFFKLRHNSGTPLKAEWVGNHVTFLESLKLRSGIFGSEEVSQSSLSVNFQNSQAEKLPYIKRRRIIDVSIFLFFLLLLGIIIVIGVKTNRFPVPKSYNDVNPKP